LELTETKTTVVFEIESIKTCYCSDIDCVVSHSDYFIIMMCLLHVALML